MARVPLLCTSHEDVVVPMNVWARHGDWIVAQYGNDPFTEAFIYNTRAKKVFLGYPSLDDDMLLDDWEALTGEKHGEI